MSLRIAATIAASIWLSGGARLRAQDWTEQAVIQEFLAGSPAVREARAKSAAIQAETQGRVLYANPEFSFSHEGAGLNEFFEFQQALPLTGRRRFLREAGSAELAASESASAARLWELRTDLRQAFYRLLAAQEYEAALRAGISELDGAITILRARETEGEGSRYDRLRAERERFEVTSQLALAQAGAAEARAALAAFLPAQTVVTQARGALTVPAVGAAASELVARALTTRAEYRAEQQQAARYQAEQKAADRLRYPEPAVSVGLKRAEVFSNNIGYGPAVGITVPIPWFNKGRTEVARFRADEEQTVARRESLERRIRAEVMGAHALLTARQAALDAYRAQVASTGAELVRIARTAYQEGELGILELLDSYRIDRQTQTRLIELAASVKEAALELDRAVGAEVNP